MRSQNLLAVTALGVALAVSGCSSLAENTVATAESSAPAVASSAAPSALAAVPSAASSASAAVSSAASNASTAASAAAGKLNANTASQEELEAALAKAGVSTPGKWAAEIIEYRPYTAENMAKLRRELAKYNIDSATLAKIQAVLRV